MRPKLLVIEGLQSFTEAQTIDFDILGEAGLFGIFGPTGSGKSTILDAITFALYGKVKRAEGGTQGIINSRCMTARVSFTFDLNKNGTRTTYRVERTYQRKKNSQNACEPKVVRLIEIKADGEIPLCDKAMEVSSKIRDLLGLNSEDFTRAVVIPQNSFQEFLMLNNSERRGMLERIFYLEEYGKQLTEKIGRKAAALKSRIDILTGELSGYADASEEALKEAKNTMEAAAALLLDTEKELKQQEIIYNQAREIWGLVQDLKDIGSKEQAHRTMGPGIDKKRQQLDKAVKADGLAAMMNRKKELALKLDETNTRLQSVMASLPGINNDLTETKNKYERVKHEAATEQPRLVELRTRLSDAIGVKNEIAALMPRICGLTGAAGELTKALGVKTQEQKRNVEEYDLLKKRLIELTKETEALKTLPEYRHEIQEGAVLENDIDAMDKSLKQLQAREAVIKKATQELERKLGDVRKEIAESLKAQDQLAASIQAHINVKPGDRSSVVKMIDRVHLVQGIYQIMMLKKKEIEQTGSKNESQRSALKDFERRCIELENIKQSAVENCEKRQKELEQCLAELDKHTAYTLSIKLKQGEPCPVCGSTIHSRPASHDGAEEFAILEKRTEDARSKLADSESLFREAERSALISAENLRAKLEQLELAERELEQKKTGFETERQKLPEKLRELEPEKLQQEIENADTSVNEKLQTIDAWEKEQVDLKERTDSRNNALAALRISENGINSELKVNHDNKVLLDMELQEISDKLAGQRLKYTEFLAKYSVVSAAAELTRLSENDRSLNRLETELEKARKLSDDMKNMIDQLNEELGRLNAEHIKAEAEVSGLNAQLRDKEIKLKELTGGADIDEGIRTVDEKLKHFAEAEKDYSQKLTQLEKLCNELNTEKSLLENQRRIYSESLENESAKLIASLDDNGFSGPEEAEASILAAEMQKELKAEIEQYDQVSLNLTAQKKMIENKLGARTITREEWELIERSYTELQEKSKNCASASEVAKSNFINIKMKNAKWAELKKTYNEVNHKHGLLIQIQKLLNAERGKDNSFIDYIAEERLRYVAAKASSILNEVTRHKFALELDAESGFIIRDNANGGMLRMVASLSGGETFLTSLSLALALSEQIQLKGQSPLEFFFLDEGFGTLDQELLDTVLDSLERLSSNQRVIGVISHVPELKVRIGRRLAITPPGFAGEGSRITIEKA